MVTLFFLFLHLVDGEEKPSEPFDRAAYQTQLSELSQKAARIQAKIEELCGALQKASLPAEEQARVTAVSRATSSFYEKMVRKSLVAAQRILDAIRGQQPSATEQKALESWASDVSVAIQILKHYETQMEALRKKRAPDIVPEESGKQLKPEPKRPRQRKPVPVPKQDGCVEFRFA